MARSHEVKPAVCFCLMACLLGCDRGETPTPPTSVAASAASPRTSASGTPVAAPTASSVANQQARLDAFEKQARQLTDDFQAALKAELLGALGNGGPGAAIGVCNVEAPRIAQKISGEAKPAGVAVSRTALKVRNPKNTPTPWQREVLGDFAEALSKAQPAKEPLEWAAVADDRLRYMRAIPTGTMCLTCHGDPEGLPDPVKAALAEKYPEDQATGFSAGELRGAFVVTAPL